MFLLNYYGRYFNFLLWLVNKNFSFIFQMSHISKTEEADNGLATGSDGSKATGGSDATKDNGGATAKNVQVNVST